MEFNEASLMPLVDVRFALGLKSSFKKVTIERYETLLRSTRSVIKYFLDNGAVNKRDKKRDPLSYQKMKDTFSKKLDPDRIAALVDNYGEPIEGAAVFLAEDISNIFNQMPVNSTKTLFGVEETDPSDYEMSKWLSKISVFFYPTDVVRHFRDGTLSMQEVENLVAIYPEYYQDIQRIAFEEIVAKKEGSLSLKDNQVISILLGIQRLSPYLITEIQKMLAISDKQDQQSDKQVAITSDSMKTEVEANLSR